MTARQDRTHGTASEAAAIFQVSPKTIARWAKEGKIPFTRTLGGHRRYDLAQLRELANGQRVEARAAE